MDKEKSSSGIGFFGMLQIVFIVLKLCNVITWSWWLVLLPTIISLDLIAIICIIAVIVYISKNRK